MKVNEFIMATSKLEKYFEKEYTNEQRQIMYEELKEMSLEKYQESIKDCIKTCKFLPKLAEILGKTERLSNFEARDYTNFDFNSLLANRDILV